jgi:hypothetical protein
MKSAALFILVFAATSAFADIAPPRVHPQWPDTCAAGDKAPNDICMLEGGFRGKCALLTARERSVLELPSRARCSGKDQRGERCLVCVSEAYRSSERPKSLPDAGKPR